MSHRRVLITRPKEQAAIWVQALRARGLDAQALPLIDIAPVEDLTALRAAWTNLPHQDFVMFVSANAAAHFFAARGVLQAWPAHTSAGSTGPGTTGALRAAGVPEACIVEPAPGATLDSESLWMRLRQRDWNGRRALIVRGEEGRDWLAETLRTAGAHVDFVAAYRRLPPRLDLEGRAALSQALAHPERHIWVFNSSQAVRHLQAVTQEWASFGGLAGTALVSHPRIAQAASEAGFDTVQVVEPGLGPLEAAIGALESKAP